MPYKLFQFRDENKKMLGFRCAILLNGVAYDKYAATTELGRKSTACC